MTARAVRIQRGIRHLTAALRRLVIGPVPRLFDGAYYLARHPRVAFFGIDPFLDYVWRGAALGHDPNADFDTAFYRRQSGATRLDPLRHYLTVGARAGLDPSPVFSTQMYLLRYDDVRASGLNPLLHYRLDGRAEGRIATAAAGDPRLWVPLAGLPEAHCRAYPAEGRPRFALTLLRDGPVTGPAAPASRIGLVLALDGVEIEGLMTAFETFEAGSLEALTVAIDTAGRRHPPAPTLVLALESCVQGPEEAGEVRLRYAEARLWNVAVVPPRMVLRAPAGRLGLRAD